MSHDLNDQLRSPSTISYYVYEKKVTARPPQLYQRLGGGALSPEGKYFCHFMGYVLSQHSNLSTLQQWDSEMSGFLLLLYVLDLQ